MLCDQYEIKKRFRIWDRFGFGEVGKWGRRWRSCYATMIVFWTFYYIQKNVSFHKFKTIDINCNFVKLVLYQTTDCCSIRDIQYLSSIKEKKKSNTCLLLLYNNIPLKCVMINCSQLLMFFISSFLSTYWYHGNLHVCVKSDWNLEPLGSWTMEDRCVSLLNESKRGISLGRCIFAFGIWVLESSHS